MDSTSIVAAPLSEMPPPPLPSPSHGPSNSISNRPTSRALKRISVNFPIQAAEHAIYRPSPLLSASPVSLSQCSTPEPRQSVFNDPNDFLTALAAQERRVLELKEELQKAEYHLEKLKNQWAVHESTKKRNELRQVEQLRPLPNSIKPSGAEAIEEAPRPSREEERKKAMYIRTKAPQRKVFEGGRHTRALSLLSPTSLSNRGATFGSIDGIKNNSANVAVQSVPNSAIGKAPRSPSHIRAQPSKGTKEDLVNTGKQLVGDIREGLWTFIEDLRQATVGDEAVAPSRQKQLTPNRASMPPRSRPPIQSPVSKRNSHFLGLQDDFSNWDTEPQPIVEDEVLSAPVKKTPNETVKDESASDDGWDNWDSPPAKTTGSPSFSTTAGSSPRTSMSSDATKDKLPKSSLDQIPWPALTKLSPSNLTRTASTLMREWEKSLTPSAEEEGKEWPARLFSG